MKTYCKEIDLTDYKQILPFVSNWYHAKRTRYNKRRVKRFLGHFGSLENLAKVISGRIAAQELKLPPIRFFERKDPSSGKLRILGNESQIQQVMDYVAVGALMPLFKAKIGAHQYASLPNRGQVAGVKRLKKWAACDKSGATYYDKMDIRHCFDSIKLEVIDKLLKRDIGKNKALQWFIHEIVATHGGGLSIGSYLSQWLANYVLSYAYRYLYEECYKIRRNKRKCLITHALFYMDDIIIFGKDKRDLKLASIRLVKFLKCLGLEVKSNHNVRPLASESVDMMGYIVHRSGKVSIRAKNYVRLRRCLLRPINYKRAKRFCAYYGYLKHSDSLKVKIKYNVFNKFKEMRLLMSRRSKNALQS